HEPVKGGRVSRDHGVGAFQGACDDLAALDTRDLVTDAELDPRVGGRECDAERTWQPALFEVAGAGGRPERARTPGREDLQHVAQPPTVLRELVPPRRGRRVEPTAADDATRLQRLQAGR